MKSACRHTRREFLAASAGLVAGTACGLAQAPPAEPIIDIHQPTHYAGA